MSVSLKPETEGTTGKIQDSRLSAIRNHFSSIQEAAYILESHYRDIVMERKDQIMEIDVIRKRCLSVMSWIEAAERKKHPGKRGFIFMGGCGNGKTTMCEAIRRFYQKLPLPMSIMMISANDLNRISSERTADDGKFERVCITPRLIIDDLGTQQPSVIDYGNQRFPFNEVLEARYNRNLITIISTNISEREEFASLYGARVFDRLHEMFIVKTFKDGSYR